jgi:pimeloyl-ACP methyl ester carboxylesterase
MDTHHTIRSADGTRIAIQTQGSGDALVLIEPPLRDRTWSAFAGLNPRLAKEFSVVTYDRRGRGESTDTLPYSPEREVEDLAAVLDAVGGTAHIYSHSSGALLALHGAAAGLPIRRMALLEPPLHDPEHDFTQPDPLTRRLDELIEQDRRDEAILHFHRSIGVPEEYLEAMMDAPDWAAKRSMAHTLVYDCRISDATTPELIAAADVPTLVLDSLGSSDNLSGWAASVASQLPDARHRSLPGEWHTVSDDVLAPVLVEFFRTGQ